MAAWLICPLPMCWCVRCPRPLDHCEFKGTLPGSSFSVSEDCWCKRHCLLRERCGFQHLERLSPLPVPATDQAALGDAIPRPLTTWGNFCRFCFVWGLSSSSERSKDVGGVLSAVPDPPVVLEAWRSAFSQCLDFHISWTLIPSSSLIFKI